MDETVRCAIHCELNVGRRGATTRGLSASSQGTDSDGDGRANLIEFLNRSNPLALGSDGLRREIRHLTVNGVASDYFCLIVPADTAAADTE